MLIWFLIASLFNLAIGEQVNHDNHFDLLVFTQHWPYTTCLDWEEKRHGGCKKIDKANWTVHGLWPTQLHKIAPGFCNNSWPFEASNLEPIMSEMETYWPDVELRDQPNSLYEHEWMKHGTCAVAGKLPGISTQQDYFTTGCRMAKENPVTAWLKEWEIVPSATSRYTMASVWNAVVSRAGTRPHIDCDKIDGDIYIKEIKVCYDKSLTRIDCDGIKSNGEKQTMMGTCLRYNDFLYPDSSIPPKPRNSKLFTTTTDVPETTTAGKEAIISTTKTTTPSTTPHITTSTKATPETSTEKPSPNPIPGPSTGFIAGIVCGILAFIAIGLGISVFIYKRGGIRGRSGYESL